MQVQNIDAYSVGVGNVGNVGSASVPSSSPLSMPVNEYLFFFFFAVFAHLKE